MVTESIQNTIKATVRSIMPDARVLLFGSMARGDANRDSDYDVLVIIPNTLPVREKFSWRSKIRIALMGVLDKDVDVLLNSEEEIQRKKTIFGHIIGEAVKEAIEL